MSKKEPTEINVKEKEEKDVFDTWFELCKECVDEAAQTQAKYVQALTNIQQEFTDITKKTAESYANIAKTAAHTAWGPIRAPTAITKGMSDFVEASTKLANINNKVVISTLELTRQNMRVYEDNIGAFTNIAINAINTWNRLVTPVRS